MLPSPITKGVSLCCSPCAIWAMVLHVVLVAHTYTHTIIAQGKGWALVWACTRFPLSSSELCSGSLLSPAQRRPRPRGQAQEASQEARLLDSWLPWTLARHFLPSPKKPSCGLSLGATRTLPGVLACFFSSLAGHLPANLHIVRASAQRATSAAVSSSWWLVASSWLEHGRG